MQEFWAPYATEPFECFLCASVATAEPSKPPYFQILPSHKNAAEYVAMPLCPACFALPVLMRHHRCVKLLRQMAGKKPDGRWKYTLQNPPWHQR